MGVKDGMFMTEDGARLIWDTIVCGFAASKELEWEVLGIPDGTMIEGQECISTPMSVSQLRDAIRLAIKRNELYGTVRVRYTRRKGGHVWLQKVGAELYPEQLESEKIIPWKKIKKRAGQ